jgi:hypothetical protein
MATTTQGKRARAARPTAEDAKYHLANLSTAAAGCRVKVTYEPESSLSNERGIPREMMASRGHLFSARILDDSGHSPDATLDDRDGNMFDQLAAYLGEMAEEFARLADVAKGARKKGGAA